MTTFLGLVTTFGEVIVIFAGFIATMIVLLKRRRIRGPVFVSLLMLLTPPLLVLSQAPWKGKHIVTKRTSGGMTFMVMQRNDGGGIAGLQMTTFWFHDGSGTWREYAIDPDNVYWRSAGLRPVASNRVDVTRFGVLIGSFDPLRKQYTPRLGEPYDASHQWTDL